MESPVTGDVRYNTERAFLVHMAREIGWAWWGSCWQKGWVNDPNGARVGEKTIIKPIAYAVKPGVGVGGRLALPGPVCTCDAFASCEFVGRCGEKGSQPGKSAASVADD